KVGRSRMDCGSFTKEIIDTVVKNSDTFFIRAQRCADLTSQIKLVNDWRKVMVGIKEVEVTSVIYQPFGEQKTYRYVVSREANRTRQIDIFQQDSFIYRAIITNEWSMSDEEIVWFYNQRGASEKIFDE